MATFKYPKIIDVLVDAADDDDVDPRDFSSDLMRLALSGYVQEHFDDEGELLDREGLVLATKDFINAVIWEVAGFMAASCGEPTEDEEATVTNSTKH